VTVDVQRGVSDHDPSPIRLKAAYATLVVGLLYAVISVYSGVGAGSVWLDA
jgi:hypothetical protein